MKADKGQNRAPAPDDRKASAPPRGRPATLSADAIVDTALKLLDAHPNEELSMARIARELSVSPPALYRYFATRTALRDAMSASVFAGFPDMPADRPWREQLLAWQNQVALLYERHHGVMMLMGWDDKLAGPWLKVQAPVLVLLHRIGFSKLSLVETASWFLAATVGLIRTYLAADSEALSRSDMVEFSEGLDHLTAGQQALVEETRTWIPSSDPARILNLGFEALVDGVARELTRLEK
ncbi:TetR/AcrR family transcriptional regulator [Sphingomonas sp. KC8]|uniref:TetR/AcrR family transcriptional regulator n=1 Tax=Sphingomonas sp. KC8 TaxID=1030157 RepID=UPI000248854E|nr:TetR/AcrR family transcriptional regulator [Sphingomonas sp. KC8]ARS28871.1 TetR family transcriptional regulator [Sphingomonas sp. KC8]